MDDGSLQVLGRSFSSPSYAAVFGIQDAGSSRSTVNGWIAWKLENGATLADLRDELLTNGNAQT